MPPSLALLVWAILLVGLLCCDPARVPRTSSALWIPVIWIFIAGSRLPDQWLGGNVGTSLQSVEQGNFVDRSVFFALIVLAIFVLVSRSFKWGDFFARNAFLSAFILFALLSVFWSDFPIIALKRWFRDLGNYLVILVVLSDLHPLDAIRTVLRRVSYLLIPLSIVLDKYFPGLSRSFDVWTGVGYYAGVTTGKNLLGLDALVSGLFFLWDILARWSDRKERRTKWIIRLNFAFLIMSLSLLKTADSTTCKVCMLLGSLVIVAVHTKFFTRHRGLLKALIPASFLSYAILALGFGMSADLAEAVGKDPTLTDRTIIWKTVLGLHTNFLLGTGYESFWMGSRLKAVWRVMPGINEAHNGYLEVYLNLGLIGLLLLCGFLISSYRTICKRLEPFSSLASLSLGLWIVMLFFCVTEAGFRSGFIWDVFLLMSVALTAKTAVETAEVPQLSTVRTGTRMPKLSWEPAGAAFRKRPEALVKRSGKKS